MEGALRGRFSKSPTQHALVSSSLVCTSNQGRMPATTRMNADCTNMGDEYITSEKKERKKKHTLPRALLTSTHAYSSQSSPRRSHPGSGYLRCTGSVISARMRGFPSRFLRSLVVGKSTRKLKLTRCCPDTDDGSSMSIGSPPKVSTPTLRSVGREERTSKSCRACSQKAHTARNTSQECVSYVCLVTLACALAVCLYALQNAHRDPTQ